MLVSTEIKRKLFERIENVLAVRMAMETLRNSFSPFGDLFLRSVILEPVLRSREAVLSSKASEVSTAIYIKGNVSKSDRYLDHFTIHQATMDEPIANLIKVC